MAVISAADILFAALAGKSSMVMAIWRSGGAPAGYEAIGRVGIAAQKAITTHRIASPDFMGRVLLWENIL
jgi:hypothetical protein